MTDQTPEVPAAEDKDAQIAALQQQLVEAQAAQSPSADAGDSIAQMSTERPEPLPAEAHMDELMAEFKAMTERVQAMEAELGQARQGYSAAVAALGPPEVATYGKGIYDKLVSLRNAHPDLPGHFDKVIAAAAPLATASTAVINGTGKVEDVTGKVDEVVAAVEKFATRTHPRTSGKPIDFSALLSDAEYASDAAAKTTA